MRNLREIHLPTYAEHRNLTLKEATINVCNQWRPQYRVVEDLIVTEKVNENWYFEVCDTKYERSKTIPTHDLLTYCNSHKKKDQHISVFSHDQKWKNEADRKGRVSGIKNTMVRMDLLWIEMDRKDYDGNADYHKAVYDAMEVYNNFPFKDHIWIFSSGNQSVHIAINGYLFGRPILSQNNTRVASRLAHAIVGDVRHRNGISNIYDVPLKTMKELYKGKDIQKVQRSLENIDPNIYSRNSLIRLPFSLHEKTGRPKEILSSNEFKPTYTPPYLLHWYYEYYKNPIKKKPLVSLYDTSYIVRAFSKAFEDFDPDYADAEGWVNGLYNPLYEDTNPSCSVNIYNGYVKDFGSISYSMTFERFLEEMSNDRR